MIKDLWLELKPLQKELDDYIFSNHNIKQSEVIDKEIVALLVELGEFANEYRAFKYWSTDQEPRTRLHCRYCLNGQRTSISNLNIKAFPLDIDAKTTKQTIKLDVAACEKCNGTGFTNPLLEEFIDVIHFTLSIEIYYKIGDGRGYGAIEQDTVELQLKELFHSISSLNFNIHKTRTNLSYLRGHVIGLINMMNFSIEDMRSAYMTKYEENKRRQENNY